MSICPQHGGRVLIETLTSAYTRDEQGPPLVGAAPGARAAKERGDGRDHYAVSRVGNALDPVPRPVPFPVPGRRDRRPVPRGPDRTATVARHPRREALKPLGTSLMPAPSGSGCSHLG